MVRENSCVQSLRKCRNKSQSSVFSELFIMVRVHKKQNNHKQDKSNNCSTCPFSNYSRRYGVLCIGTNLCDEWNRIAWLCASVFVVRFVPDMLRLYIIQNLVRLDLKNKSNESLSVKHSFLAKLF